MANFYPSSDFAFPSSAQRLSDLPPVFSSHLLSDSSAQAYTATDSKMWGAADVRLASVNTEPLQADTHLCLEQRTPLNVCQSLSAFPVVGAMPGYNCPSLPIAGVGPVQGYNTATLPSSLVGSLGWSTMMTPNKEGVVNFLATDLTPSSPFSNLSAGTPTGATNEPIRTSSLHPIGRSKRKALSSLSDEPATKFHVNEDRMAMCMNDLHLDNNNLDWHPDLEEQPWYTQYQTTSNSNRSSTSSRNHAALPRQNRRFEIHENTTIELCRELEEEFKTNDRLPKVIRDEINKSSMQIMLWRPPGECITETLKKNKQLLEESSSGVSSSSGSKIKDNNDGEQKTNESRKSSTQMSMRSSPCEDNVIVAPVSEPDHSNYLYLPLPEDDSNMEF